MASHGSDEVSALVFEFGSFMTKAGYAGEDCPRCLFPSLVGSTPAPHAEPSTAEAASRKPACARDSTRYHVGDLATNFPREHMEMRELSADGLVADGDVFEQLCDYAYFDRLRADPKEHPLLMAEPAFNTREVREKACEIVFEKYSAPAFFLCKNPVLSSFAFGRATALVVDVGHQMTSVSAVCDGYVLRRSVVRQPLAGAFLNGQIRLQFEQELRVAIHPTYLVRDKQAVRGGEPAKFTRRELRNLTPSYHRAMEDKIINDYKESACQVFETAYDESAVSLLPAKPYEFADGYNRNFVSERFRIPEILFSPSRFTYKAIKPEHTAPAETGGGEDESLPASKTGLVGLAEMIYQSVASCDVDVRPALLNNMIITGGSSLFPGFADRVYHELMTLSPASKIKIIAPTNSTERKFSAWIGGSILASLGTFQQAWVSKQEYQESGRSLVEKRCP